MTEGDGGTGRGVTGYRADGIGNARGCVVKGLDKRPLSVMLKVVSNDTIKSPLIIECRTTERDFAESGPLVEWDVKNSC